MALPCKLLAWCWNRWQSSKYLKHLQSKGWNFGAISNWKSWLWPAHAPPDTILPGRPFLRAFAKSSMTSPAASPKKIPARATWPIPSMPISTARRRKKAVAFPG